MYRESKREAMVRSPGRSDIGAAVTVKPERYCHVLQKYMRPQLRRRHLKRKKCLFLAR